MRMRTRLVNGGYPPLHEYFLRSACVLIQKNSPTEFASIYEKKMISLHVAFVEFAQVQRRATKHIHTRPREDEDEIEGCLHHDLGRGGDPRLFITRSIRVETLPTQYSELTCDLQKVDELWIGHHG